MTLRVRNPKGTEVTYHGAADEIRSIINVFASSVPTECYEVKEIPNKEGVPEELLLLIKVRREAL